jgi:hypothetical protein
MTNLGVYFNIFIIIYSKSVQSDWSKLLTPSACNNTSYQAPARSVVLNIQWLYEIVLADILEFRIASYHCSNYNVEWSETINQEFKLWENWAAI